MRTYIQIDLRFKPIKNTQIIKNLSVSVYYSFNILCNDRASIEEEKRYKMIQKLSIIIFKAII